MYFMLELMEARKAREAATSLSLGSLAAQGTGKAIREQLKALKRAGG